MTPATAIGMLDRALARNGTVVTLRRYSGTGPARTSEEISVRARSRDYEPAEVMGGITQGDSEVVLSPTQLAASTWGGGAWMPRKDDRVVVGGRERTVLAVDPERIADQVVRINLQVRG